MSSPKLQEFTLRNQTTGALVTGQEGGMSFDVYTDTDGVAISPEPNITEIASTGHYQFTPTFADTTKGIIYSLNTGYGTPTIILDGFIRPEDWNTDDIPEVKDRVFRIQELKEGKWEFHTDGPYINNIVQYAADGSTIRQRWELQTEDGTPTSNPALVFKRVPQIAIT